MTDENTLQIRKLELEIEDLKTKISWYQKVLSLLPIFTIIFALTGLWYNFYQFSESQKRQADREEKTRLDEYRKSFYEKRLALYVEAVDIASKISNNPVESKERREAEQRFLELYTGALHVVADKRFSEAKVNFFFCYHEGEPADCTSEPQKQQELRRLSLELAASAKQSILQAWKVDSED